MSALSAGVVRALTEEIVSGQRQAGDKLPTETALGVEHGVSRTVVREAMSRLQAAGLVESVRGKGSFVLAQPAVTFSAAATAPRSADEVRELWELRLALEVSAAAWAAQRRSRADLDRLQRAVDTFATAQRPADALEADRAFHRTLASAGGNTRLVTALDSLGPAMIMMPPDRLQDGERPKDRESGRRGRHDLVTEEHRQIVTAVADRDAELAAAAVRMHLSASRRRLMNRQ